MAMTLADHVAVPIRSPLFVPAHRLKMVEKALDGATGADAVIIDLEDGVPVDQRSAAVDVVVQLGNQEAPRVPAYFRVRSPVRASLEDLSIVPSWAAGVVLAKAEDPESLITVAKALHDRRLDIELWLQIESALGVERLPQLVGTGAPVTALFLGATDLRADLGARASDDEMELLYARSRLVMVTSAYSIPRVIDTPEARVDDEVRLARVAKHVRSLGFTAKACIHPRQVPVVSSQFAPSTDEVAWAHAVLESADGAQKMGDELVDEATKRTARQILGAAKA